MVINKIRGSRRFKNKSKNTRRRGKYDYKSYNRNWIKKRSIWKKCHLLHNSSAKLTLIYEFLYVNNK